jgi:predicted enzyme related to lactoylglutathione lyase
MKTEGIYLSWIVVKDIKAAITFYTTVAGLTLKEFNPEFGWAELSGPEGAILGLAQENKEYGQFAGTNAVVTISVDDIHSACEQFKKNGAILLGELIEIPGHVIMQTFQDSDGNTMQLVQQL